VAWLLVLTALALAPRWLATDHGLPHLRDDDPHIVNTQLYLFNDSPLFLDRQGQVNRKALAVSSVYPHLVGRLAHLGSVVAPVRYPSPDAGLEAHLRAAGSDDRRVRRIVALLSVLVVPGTYCLARSFLDRRWSLAAAALAGLAPLAIRFGTQARPHAPAAALVCCALAAAVRLRREDTKLALTRAGVWTALAIGTLQSALAVLLANAAALMLRRSARRPWRDPRLLIPLGLLALSLLCFWPFLFVWDTPSELGNARTSEGLSLLSPARLLSDFNGRGVGPLFRALWSHEPLTLGLALLAAAWWCARNWKRTASVGSRAQDVAIVAAYALTYTLILLAFDHTVERFCLPLLPVMAVMTCWCLRELFRGSRLRRGFARVLALATFGLPVAAGVRWSVLHSRPDSLTDAARVLEESVDGSSARIGVLAAMDLPLARTQEGLFGPKLTARDDVFSPWSRYQQKLFTANPAWPGKRWMLLPAFDPRSLARNATLADVEEYVRRERYDYLLLPGTEVCAHSRRLRLVEEWAVQRDESAQVAEAQALLLSGKTPSQERKPGESYENSPHLERHGGHGGHQQYEPRVAIDSNFLQHLFTSDKLGPSWRLYRMQP
jgi:hypothetical protein